ncbi:LAETG motif-containing sortase-dependent surface protein [Streptomyces sp. NPDC013953]|uniref:LAETG motif-containing sortase-dependent surface protein n=1 Tax=Streptomyces sp. NPDC013953 TaxID=3364868 RepID=UPI0037008F9E
MTLSIRPGRSAAAFVAATAVLGVTGTALSAVPAAAHTPAWSVTCSEVQVDLTAYTADAPNQVTVTVDGKDLLPTRTFGREFHEKLRLPDHDKELTVRLVVKDGSEGGKFSRDETRTAPVCETPAPIPSTTPSTTPPPATGTPAPPPTPTDTPPSAEVPPAEPSTPAPGPTGPGLAETGSSGTTPLIGGAAAAVLLAGGGILWAVRRRRTARS